MQLWCAHTCLHKLILIRKQARAYAAPLPSGLCVQPTCWVRFESIVCECVCVCVRVHKASYMLTRARNPSKLLYITPKSD